MQTKFSPERRRFIRGTLGAVGAATLGSLPFEHAFAAGYPEKPIVFICPWPAGGTADVTMHIKYLCQGGL